MKEEEEEELSDTATLQPPAKQQPKPSLSRQPRPHVLLGITGSVAAVKGPEIAVRLVHELQAEVRILLTRGGRNFWTKAEAYHPDYWRECKRLETSNSAANPKQEEIERQQQQKKQQQQQQQQVQTDDNDEDDDEDNHQNIPSIQVHCKKSKLPRMKHPREWSFHGTHVSCMFIVYVTAIIYVWHM